jgi:hypothetical protein
MDIRESTRSYERWLGRHVRLLPADLRRKHTRMTESPFVLLRGTFYRRMQLWPDACREIADAPTVVPSAICTSRISVPGGTPKGASSGVSTTSTKPGGSPTPTISRDGWIVRRLSPDCSRIELDQIASERDEWPLLRAMGWETANIHLGTRGARVASDLRRRPSSRLDRATRIMARATEADWRVWSG